MLGDFPSIAVAVAPNVMRHHHVDVMTAGAAQSVQRAVAPFGFAVQASESDATRLLEALEPTLVMLPSLLRTRIIAMFGADAPVESPATLASRAGMSRRSLDRWLARVGAPSGRRLVALPPTLRAIRLLRDTELPIRRVASLCGLRSPRRLNDYMTELTGLSTHEIREGDEPIEMLVDRIIGSLSTAEP